jgi:CheY-like chemotaxis protein
MTRHSIKETRKMGIRLLIVEDNPVNQKLACHLTERFGYFSEKAGNGREAIEILSRQDFNLVLMDVHMPVMDGIEAVGLIRKGADGVRQPDIPIIALTADVVQGSAESFLQAGMNDYVTKPINPEALLNTIKKWALKNIKPGEPAVSPDTTQPSDSADPCH